MNFPFLCLRDLLAVMHDPHLKNRTFYFPLNLFIHPGSQLCARGLLNDSFFSSTDLEKTMGSQLLDPSQSANNLIRHVRLDHPGSAHG
jgi:hypothetical protein